jgi:hypothetical protein
MRDVHVRAMRGRRSQVEGVYESEAGKRRMAVWTGQAYRQKQKALPAPMRLTLGWRRLGAEYAEEVKQGENGTSRRTRKC